MQFVAVKCVVLLAYLETVDQKVTNPLIQWAAFFKDSKSVTNTEIDNGAKLKICVTFKTLYQEKQLLWNFCLPYEYQDVKVWVSSPLQMKKVKLAVQSVQLRSWKWLWPEQKEWNAQQAAGGTYHLSLSLHALEYPVQLFEALDTTHLKVSFRETLHKMFKINIFYCSANSPSHNIFWPNVQFYLNEDPSFGWLPTNKQSTQLKPIV